MATTKLQRKMTVERDPMRSDMQDMKQLGDLIDPLDQARASSGAIQYHLFTADTVKER